MMSTDTVILASSSSEITNEYISVFWIALAALLSPLASALTRKKIPDVVFLIAFGIIIGPNILHLADTEGGVELIKELGLGVLFLIAGYEINTAKLKSRQGGSAIVVWLICFALGILGAGIMAGFSKPFTSLVAVGIALSSTALGTLLPMLKNNGASGTKVGDAFLLHGAVGEVMPIFAMALLLSTHSPIMAVVILLLFMVIAVASAIIPHRAFEHIPGLRRVMAAEANTTSQTMLRLAMLLLAALMMAAAVFELDVVLGAFSAGIILRSLTPNGAVEPFTKRLEVLGFSFLIPLFFICSGMGIDITVVTKEPLTLVMILVGILLIRGLPVFLAEQFTNTDSGLKTVNEKVQLALYSSAGLPIIVAVTQVATSHDLISQDMASLLVTGGAITVLLFPIWAVTVHKVFPAHSEDEDSQQDDDKSGKKKSQQNSSSKKKDADANRPKTSQELKSEKKSERAQMVKEQTGAIPIVKADKN